MTTFQTSRTPHLLLAAGLTLVTLATGPALAAEIHLDHQGSHRRFDIDQRGYGATDLTSRGDGGRLDATLRGTGETEVFMLGDGVRGQVFDAGAGGSVYMGMCPPGMRLEPVYRAAGSTRMRIPRCIY